MKNLYAGLKARVVAKDLTSIIKFIGKWDQSVLDRLEKGKDHAFRLPAVFFEFVSPQDVISVGGGVQLFDPLVVRVHVLHEFYNDTDTGTRINLDVYDVGKTVHGWIQNYQVTGADYGSGPLCRTSVEEDDTHGQVFHYIASYTTTWVDNSTTYPEGGIEQDPPFYADISAETLEAEANTLTPSVGSLAFGEVSLGESSTLTFTISGEHLDEDPADGEPLVIATTNGDYLISFSTNFKTRLSITPTEGTIDETTVSVKFTPSRSGGISGAILYGVPGTNGQITLSGTGIGYLLQENGDFLTQENGDKILL